MQPLRILTLLLILLFTTGTAAAQTGDGELGIGFWKQDPRYDYWTPDLPPHTPFAAIFDDAFPGLTLLDVLRQGGGGLNALGRQTVTALLNANSPEIEFGMTYAEVVQAFNDVYPGTNADYTALKNMFEELNDAARVADDVTKVAVLFVGHGEPVVVENGDVPITLSDGTPFGPHAVSLGVPVEYQYTEWAAAYEEIATALTYIFGDFNNNGIMHELRIFPMGDVPPFFTWEAFHAEIYHVYNSFGNYSPHNDVISEHVANLDVRAVGVDEDEEVQVDVYMAYLDAVPRIMDVVWNMKQMDDYDEMVVVPLLLAESTHTTEVTDLVCEAAHLTAGMEVIVLEPFFELPFMKNRLKEAVVAMAHHMRENVPADVADEDIGVLLASHGTPYVPPFPEFGWEEGLIYSNLIPTEDEFHDEIERILPWAVETGRMNYSSPTIPEALEALEAAGLSHVIVVPSAFPTPAMHTMWDVPKNIFGHAVVPADGVVSETRPSGMTVYYSALGYADFEVGRNELRAGLDFIAEVGVMEALAAPDHIECLEEGPEYGCEPDEICVTVTAQATTGPDLKLMLFEVTGDNWPTDFLSVPTPGWVITENTPVPDEFPIHIQIPMAGNVYAIGGEPIEGKRLGLCVVTGVASNFIVEPTDARGFSASTIVYEPGTAMSFGEIDLYVPEGDACTTNPFNPWCLSGPLFWEEYMLGDPDFVPGAIYMDTADLDGDGMKDIIMVGEPHFEFPETPLEDLKLGVYYLNPDFSVREMEVVDQWSAADPLFYSPWGVRVIEHSGEPMIIVGLNIPDLAPLEDGFGHILSYRRDGGGWLREIVMENTDPRVTNYNAMIVVVDDMDNDGDTDLALSSAFGSSAVGSWMENTGVITDPWIPHLQTMDPGTDPNIRGVLGYKSADLNGDGYPEVVYNAMFNVPNTDPPQYRGEIWLGVNPGPTGWDAPWQMIVIDDDNWASADMWFHDFDGDSDLDLVANQIFNATVTLYNHPGADLAAEWTQDIIISGLTSPSDMWLADMNDDGLMDVVSADHTAHRGVWHRNPGAEPGALWVQNLIFRDIRLPGDFVMTDMDDDGDLDYVGTTLTTGQAFIVEQTAPETSVVANVSLPDGFDGQITQLIVALVSQVPATGPPDAVLALIANQDADENGVPDVEHVLNASRDLTVGVADAGLFGTYHVMAVLFMEGGGVFEPVPGVDYMAVSAPVMVGAGQVAVDLDLELFGFGPVPGSAKATMWK